MYQDIKDSYDKFSDIGLLKKELVYKKYDNSFISYLKDDLSDYELIDVSSEGRNLAREIEAFRQKSSFRRMFKGKIKKSVNNYGKKYFSKINKQIRKFFQKGKSIDHLTQDDMYTVNKTLIESLLFSLDGYSPKEAFILLFGQEAFDKLF